MKVTIMQPTRHDGRRYAAGDTPDLPKAAASALIDCGSAEPAGKTRPQDPPADHALQPDPAVDSALPLDPAADLDAPQG